MTATAVQDGRPPLVLVATLNPVMRTLLRTPMGRLIKGVALLEFAGRRSGHRYRVPVGWYDIDGPVVFTPAGWRVNFGGGADATVRARGRTTRMRGVLIENPSDVADALNTVLARGTSPRSVGIAMPKGHTLCAADVAALQRAMIRFEPADG